MKKYSHAIQQNQLNKRYARQKRQGGIRKRRIWIFVFAIWVLCVISGMEPENLFYELTTQLLPLFTYEQEYGLTDIDYAANYQVPAWFHEDEGVTMETGSLADTEGDGMAILQNAIADAEGAGNGSEQAEQEPKITTLADGVKGNGYTREQMQNKDFLLSKIFVVDSNTSMTKEELSLENLLDQDMSVAGLKDWGQGEKGKDKECKILIYHTHASESFADSRAGKQEDTIVGVGSYLTKILEEQYGIPVYHDTTAYDMIDGVLDRSKAYENAYDSVSKILADNPSIEVVIDLHRDGVNEETHLVTDINGKKTAKIMFLNGVSRSNTNGEIEYLKNPNKLANLAFSFQMYLAGREYYGDYVRKIYVKSLRFNLHLLPRTALIEVGAQNNLLEEEKNAMEPLAAILNQVLSDEE
ncbi:MAG: stage II sporulation protein P [Clostridium sp.]|nr:stage II sporulation protein P [Clostridium sp.]